MSCAVMSATRTITFGILLIATASCLAQVPPYKDQVITADKLGLPKDNGRVSEPVKRVYKTDDKNNILPGGEQPHPYPFTPKPGYELKQNEKLRPHYGVDITTRPQGKQSSAPMDYKSGTYGVVTRVGTESTKPITVTLVDGSTLIYRHSSKVYVKVGDKVTPDTIIAKSGDKGARPGAFHVHIEAKSKDGKYMNPDQAFQAGQRSPSESVLKSILRGVLVNPLPKKEETPSDPGQADKILQKRPDGTSVKWPIRLPKEVQDEKDK